MSTSRGGHGGKAFAAADVSLTTLQNFRACRDLSANPDNCSSWVTP